MTAAYLTPREFVGSLPREQLILICRDYERLERDGHLGATVLLRSIAQQYVAQFPRVARLPIVSVMRDFAYEAYRRLARDSMAPGVLDP